MIKLHAPMAYRNALRLESTKVETVNQANYSSFIAAHPNAILKVGFGSSCRFLEDVQRYFSTEYPARFGFGYLDRLEVVAYGLWSKKHLARFEAASTAIGAPDGYYLFSDGQAVAYHPCVIANNADLAFTALSLLLSSALDSSAPLNAANRKDAERVIAFFEHAMDVAEKAQARPPTKRDDDPYAILGISAAATDEEVAAAFAQQIHLYHPDKVATRGPAIQRVAEEQTKAINRAHATIKQLRRKGAKR